MIDIVEFKYSVRDVQTVAGVNFRDLLNWNRRGLLARLTPQKSDGPRLYCARDMFVILAEREVRALGITPNDLEPSLFEHIAGNCTHRYFSRKGVWGETPPNAKNLYRFVAVYSEDGKLKSLDLPSPGWDFGKAVRVVIDCHRLSDQIMEKLESME